MNKLSITLFLLTFAVLQYGLSQVSIEGYIGLEAAFVDEKVLPDNGFIEILEKPILSPLVGLALRKKMSGNFDLGIKMLYREYRVHAGLVGNFLILNELGFRSFGLGTESKFYLDKKQKWSLNFSLLGNFYFNHYHRTTMQRRSDEDARRAYNNIEFGASAGIGYSIKKMTVLASYYRGLAYRDKELYQGYIDNVQSVSLGISYRFYQK